MCSEGHISCGEPRLASRESGVSVLHNFGGSPVTKQYKFGASASWEGIHRSGVALPMRHRHFSPTGSRP